jgi:uracil-DNA glycosylase family 4
MPVHGKGRKKIMLVGEAPGCISGDSLIDTAFRDKSRDPWGIPIKDLAGKSGFFVYSFDVKKQKLILGKVRRVWKSGRKKVYRVTYEWKFADGEEVKTLRNSIVVSSNHPFLLKRSIAHDPFKGLPATGDYLSIDHGLKAGHSIQPFHRRVTGGYAFVGAFASSMRKESRLLLEHVLGRRLVKNHRKAGEECHHKDENKLNDSRKNLELHTTASHAEHHANKLNPMNRPGIKEKHRKAMDSVEYRKKQSDRMKEILANPEVYQARLQQIQDTNGDRSATVKSRFRTDPLYYYRYLIGRSKTVSNQEGWVENKFRERFPNESFPPVDNHKIVSIEYVGVEDVYDMEVEKHHNFAVNGIFVHNSNEDEEGIPFSDNGKSGELLWRTLAKYGVERNDCWTTNSARCRPPHNKYPEKTVGYCRPFLVQAVTELKPEIIILLGAKAVASLLGWREVWGSDIGKASRWDGWRIPCQHLNAWICPTWHPSYIIRTDYGESGEQEDWKGDRNNEVRKMLFERHLKAACKLKGKPWGMTPDYKSRVTVELDPNRAAQYVYAVRDMGLPTAIDYETDRLKPDMKDSRIVSCAVSNGKHTIAYPWHGEAIRATGELIRSKVPKIASHMSFEQRWCIKEFGTAGRNWRWDTMTTAHCLDNRPSISGIEFQAFVNLGQAPWDEGVSEYFDSGKGGANAENRIREVPRERLLLYGGMDALLEFEVAQIQAKRLGVAL